MRDGSVVLIVVIVTIVVFVVAFMMGALTVAVRLKQGIRDARRDTAKRQRAVVGGQVSEQLAPFFPDFPYRPSEARFIGKPVDLVVFVGMDARRIEKVVFVEVKTGTSTLSAQERHLRDAIEQGRVEFLTYSRP